jgi:hypothetical protein
MQPPSTVETVITEAEVLRLTSGLIVHTTISGVIVHAC